MAFTMHISRSIQILSLAFSLSLASLSFPFSAFAETGPTRVGSQLTWTAAGKMALFVRGQNNALYYAERNGIEAPTDASWNSFEYLDGVIKGNPVSLFDWDSRLLVVARGTDDTLFFRKETSSGSKTFDWWGQVPDYALSGEDVPPFQGDPAMIRNNDGRLSIYSAAIDGSVWQTVQSAPGKEFGGWTSLGKPGNGIQSGVVAAISANGAVFLAVTAKNNKMFVIGQDASHGTFGEWVNIGGHFTAKDEKNVLSFVVEKNGRLSIIANNSGGTVSSSSQTAINSQSWTAWSNLLGGAHGSNSRPAAVTQADGRVTVFFWANYGTSLQWQYQTKAATTKWSNWFTLSGIVNDTPLTIKDVRDVIHVIDVGSDGLLHEIQQTAPDADSWTDWSTGLVSKTAL